jgi:hypothetical protein
LPKIKFRNGQREFEKTSGRACAFQELLKSLPKGGWSVDPQRVLAAIYLDRPEERDKVGNVVSVAMRDEYFRKPVRIQS